MEGAHAHQKVLRETALRPLDVFRLPVSRQRIDETQALQASCPVCQPARRSLLPFQVAEVSLVSNFHANRLDFSALVQLGLPTKLDQATGPLLLFCAP